MWGGGDRGRDSAALCRGVGVRQGATGCDRVFSEWAVMQYRPQKWYFGVSASMGDAKKGVAGVAGVAGIFSRTARPPPKQLFDTVFDADQLGCPRGCDTCDTWDQYEKCRALCFWRGWPVWEYRTYLAFQSDDLNHCRGVRCEAGRNLIYRHWHRRNPAYSHRWCRCRRYLGD